jgi:hypothetical protein
MMPRQRSSRATRRHAHDAAKECFKAINQCLNTMVLQRIGAGALAHGLPLRVVLHQLVHIGHQLLKGMRTAPDLLTFQDTI